ncbi:MAG: lysophospholipid acyltransferase family protein [Nocardioides sp.]
MTSPALSRVAETPAPATWMLHGLRPLARRLLTSWYDVRVAGAEHVPADGPVILAANHVGWLDGPLLASIGSRPVHVLTKIEMFDGPLGRILLGAGQIPLDRSASDIRAVRTCTRVLVDGGCIGIFPEGYRGAGDLTRFRNGAAYLALVTGAPIVPLTFLGTRLPGGSAGSLPPRGARIDVVHGAPFSVAAQPWPRTRAHVAATSADLHDHLRGCLDAARAATGRALPGPIPEGSHV